MQGSKLIRLIETFDQKALERLRLFVYSPYFNNGPKSELIQQLFQLIYEAAPGFSKEKVLKARVYAAIFPDEVVVKGKLEKLMTQLLGLVMDFIATEYSPARQKESARLLVQMQFFKEQELSNQFEIAVKKLNQVLAKRQFQDRDFFYDKFRLEQELVDYYGQQNSRTEDLNLPATLKQLDIYYLTAKLEYSIWLLSQNIHIPLDLEDSLILLEKVVPFIERESYLNLPILRIYHQAFLLLHKHDQDNHQEFTNLKHLLAEYGDEIDPEQLKALQTLLRIHAIGHCNRGNDTYLPEAFQLYQNHLNLGYLYHDGKLFPGTVRNVVVLGLRMGEADWVYDFLQIHQDKITATQHPEEVYHFNLANYYFAIQEYDNALNYLDDTYEDLYYKLAAKRLEIKIYFEQNSPLLEPRLEAFKVYIFRLSQKRLPEKHRMGNNHFIDLLRQIINPKTFKNKERIAKLSERIEEKKIVAEKEWLLDKLQKMPV